MGSNGPTWGLRSTKVRIKRDAAEQAQKIADRLACEAWNERLALLRGPLQPSPSLRAAISGGFPFLRVVCSACKTVGWRDLRTVRRPGGTPIWKLEASLVCRPCRELTRFAPRCAIEKLCRHDKQFGWSDAAMAEQKRPETLEEVLKALHASEINCSIASFYDGCWEVKLGDALNGFEATETFPDLDQAIEWLRSEAIRRHPESKFAKSLA